MTAIELIFWEPLISPHKLGLLKELRSSVRVASISQVAQIQLSAERKALGWEALIPDCIPTVVEPSDAQVSEIILGSSPDAIHIFSGIHWVPSIVRGIALAIQHKRRFGIMSEPRVLEGFKGITRLAHSWLTEGRVRSHCDFVLAIGRHGPGWFRIAGYSPQKIFPFAYFVGEAQNGNKLLDSQKIRVGYLGRLTHAKGFTLAAEVFRLFAGRLEIEIAGGGELEHAAYGLASEYPASIRFRGALPMANVPGFLASLDILLVPSLTRDDGWGVVITEALEAGVAVISSGFPGASACITDERFGRIVERPNIQSFAQAIDKVIASGVLDNEGRKFRSSWSSTHLTASAGSSYLLDILGHVYQGSDLPELLFPRS